MDNSMETAMEVFTKIKPKEKKVIGRRPKWTPEYQHMVAQKVVEEGMKFREAAKNFGMSTAAVNACVKRYRKGTIFKNAAEKEQSSEYKLYALEEQIKDLKTEIGDLFLQNQMLKKALYHSQSPKKETSSVITSKNLDQYRKDAK